MGYCVQARFQKHQGDETSVSIRRYVRVPNWAQSAKCDINATATVSAMPIFVSGYMDTA